MLQRTITSSSLNGKQHAVFSIYLSILKHKKNLSNAQVVPLRDSVELVSLPTGSDVNHTNDVAYNKVFSHILVIKSANNKHWFGKFSG